MKDICCLVFGCPGTPGGRYCVFLIMIFYLFSGLLYGNLPRRQEYRHFLLFTKNFYRIFVFVVQLCNLFLFLFLQVSCNLRVCIASSLLFPPRTVPRSCS
uniref:Uncharacterized protein n=1 Tax=Cacopsylla melanoneura TaxID=428564 RepID=A0A8D8VJQ5_9HEMI